MRHPFRASIGMFENRIRNSIIFCRMCRKSLLDVCSSKLQRCTLKLELQAYWTCANGGVWRSRPTSCKAHPYPRWMHVAVIEVSCIVSTKSSGASQTSSEREESGAEGIFHARYMYLSEVESCGVCLHYGALKASKT